MALTASAAREATSSPTSPGRSGRLDYIDALRVLLIVLVVAHHAGQAYGPGSGGQAGGLWPVADPSKSAILPSFFSVNAAFFMGLFFLISALFVPASFDRKGTTAFLKDRFIRLGVPLLVVLLLGEVAAYASPPAEGSGSENFGARMLAVASLFALDRGFPGHLWFVEHLLVYALVYAGWRLLTARWSLRPLPIPSNKAILTYAAALSIVTFVVRIDYPINRWVDLFGLVYSEVGHLPQYASLFVIGLLAARGKWLQRVPTRRGLVWFAIGLVCAAARYLLPIGAPGGANLGSAIWSTCESVIATGLCLGLIVVFREYVARPGRLLRAAAPNTYGVYIIHLFVVIALQIVLLAITAAALAKFAIVTLVAVLISFALMAAVRQLRVVRAVL